jgi:chromosome segregation ATPase
MLWRKLLSDKTDFENECLDRITTGYLYQLLQADGNVRADFKHLRALETFLGGLAKTTVSIINERNDQIRQGNEQLSAANEQLGKAHERLKECDAKIEEMLGMAAQKDEQLTSYREALVELEKRVKDHGEELRRSNERIADLRNSISWKITSPLRAVYSILLRQKK